MAMETGSAPKREPEVTAQLNSLDRAIGQLSEDFGALVKRLEPVLTPVATGTAESNIKEQSMPQMADRLRTYRHRIEAIREAVQAVLNTLEI